MVEISKHLFDEVCRDVHCSKIVHPWNSSCWSSTFYTYQNAFVGSAKFYFVIHLTQNLFKGKKILTRKAMIKAGEYYARSTLLGMLINASSVTLTCILRWLLGRKFTYYTYIFGPSALSGLFIILEPPSRRGLIVNLFCNLVIEYWIRSLERAGYISITKAKITFLFMLGSSLLFYLMRLEGEKQNHTPFLWLFKPEKVRQKPTDHENVCPHDGPCLKYILKGSAICCGIGLAFSMAKLLGPLLKSPLKTLANIDSKHFRMAMFFGSYIGIYRTIVCFLCRKQGYDSALYALPAGYLAGLSFLFQPNLGFAIASLSGAFKLYCTILYEKKVIPNSIYIPLVLYCLSQSTLFHARFMHPQVCPTYVFNLIRSVSNGTAEAMYSSFKETITKSNI